MNHPMRSWTWLAAWAVVGVVCSSSLAQQGPPAGGPGAYRQLAPGVLKTVDPARRLAETFSRHDVVELLAFDPKFDWARDEPFRHDIWTLEFKFKPVRMIWVDVPQPSGNMQKQLIWYMVYSVTNRKIEEKTVDEKTLQFFEKAQAQAVAVGGNQGGKALPQHGWMHPVQSAEGTWQIQFLNKPIRFIPEFLLESPEFDKPYENPTG